MNQLRNFGIKTHPTRDKWGRNMPKLQVDLTDEEDRQLALYKLKYDLPNKQSALKQLLTQGHRPLDLSYDREERNKKNEEKNE